MPKRAVLIFTVCVGLAAAVWPRPDFKLVGEQPLEGASCPAPDWLEATLFAAEQTGAPVGGNIKPIRTVNDPYPTFAGIAVDPVNHEVVVSDENRFSLLVYDRRDDTILV